MTALAICVVTAAAVVPLPTAQLTLAWTHSVERVRWEEDYRAEAADGASLRLRATQARIRGSGAGMEPPDGAVLRDGWWHYVPAQPLHRQLRLARSPYAGDYELCWDGRCRMLAALAPAGADERVTELRACSTP